MATSSEAGTPVLDAACAKAVRNRDGTGQPTPSDAFANPDRAGTWHTLEFTLQGTSVRVTYVAVSPAATAKVAPHEGVGRQIDSATGTRSGRVLTVTFTGSPGPGSRPCGADYDAEAVESSLGVVVIVHEHRYVDPDPSASPIICTSEGAFRMANVELAQPLGDRAVLDPKEGLPVPVTLTN